GDIFVQNFAKQTVFHKDLKEEDTVYPVFPAMRRPYLSACELLKEFPSEYCSLGDSLDFCTEPRQFFFDPFVAAIQMVDALDDALPFRRKSREHKTCAGPQIRGHYICPGQRGASIYVRNSLMDRDVGAHAHQLADMHKSVLEDGFVDRGSPFGLSHQRHVLRL